MKSREWNISASCLQELEAQLTRCSGYSSTAHELLTHAQSSNSSLDHVPIMQPLTPLSFVLFSPTLDGDARPSTKTRTLLYYHAMSRLQIGPSLISSVYTSEEGGLRKAKYSTYNTPDPFLSKLCPFITSISVTWAFWAVKRFAIFAFLLASVLYSRSTKGDRVSKVSYIYILTML